MRQLLNVRPQRYQPARLQTAAVAFAALLALVFMFVAFPIRGVTVDADGRLLEVRIRDAAGSAVERAGLFVGPNDRVVSQGDRVKVERARSIVVHADGDERPLNTQADTVAEALEEAGVEYGPEDTVLYDGFPTHPSAELEEHPQALTPDVASLGRFNPGPAGETPLPPAYLDVRRPQSITITVDGDETSVVSSRVRVDELLAEAGIRFEESDFVTPASDGLIGDDLQITVLREKTIHLVVSGELTTVTSFRRTVREVLEDAEIDHMDTDLIDPGLDATLSDGMSVTITQIRDGLVVIDQAIPYKTIYREDPELPVGETRVDQEGIAGLRHHEYRLDLRDGSETERELVREWVDPAPQDEIIALGTDLDVRTLETEEGSFVPYVDVLEVLATWYNATCDGCDDVTSTLTPLRYGVIAVDPDVIPLGTCLYVPGYGFGRAEDVGGEIKGNRIDLGFPGAADGSWWGSREVEVYVLPSCPD
jgi:resuscitation-promoting factor RpfB